MCILGVNIAATSVKGNIALLPARFTGLVLTANQMDRY